MAMILSFDAKAIDFTEQDKKLHFIAGCGVQKVIQAIAKDRNMSYPSLVGAMAAGSVGILKEVADSRSADHTPDVNDITATIIGASVCMTF